jgi:SAM-dependent methyltransferase
LVNIHHQLSGDAVADADALPLFERQWTIYQKCIDNDYLSHREAYQALHRRLVDRFDGPFSFLDLACGDASQTAKALKGTTVVHYHGVDLAMPALERAARNLETLDCDIELEQSDYIEAIRKRPEPADVVWIGLSLHHLLATQKRDLMREIRRMVGPDGLFALYEPTLADGEDRDGFLDRWEAHGRATYATLTVDELDTLVEHVRTCDFQEPMPTWRAIAEEAGFARTELVFTDPDNFFRLICFTG